MSFRRVCYEEVYTNILAAQDHIPQYISIQPLPRPVLLQATETETQRFDRTVSPVLALSASPTDLSHSAYASIPREPIERTPLPSHSLGRANSLIRSASPSPALNLHQPPSSHVIPPPPAVAVAVERFRSPSSTHAGHVHDKLSTRETASLAAVFCFAWFAANWSVNASLGLTSVGSSTILAGMSGRHSSTFLLWDYC